MGKTQIIIELTNEQKNLIVEASKKISLGHSTFCRMFSLQHAKEILQEDQHA